MNSKVRQLYKNLLFMGRDYPEQSGGYVKFRKVLKRNFQTTEIHGEEDLERALTKGKYIEKGM